MPPVWIFAVAFTLAPVTVDVVVIVLLVDIVPKPEPIEPVVNAPTPVMPV